ncbi:mannitol-1-phosphate 5-dehydrogenase [Cohnella luojiensis]|uniref:Mannitol-1-phosphate 5-dehydrogenase n=1 Tax=Cohnella luojiensis TaxID=652876 RepID=A0A4Y8LP33_9BACL|nr:mannitol-1-phosphate 5-dehydrogenase [Cohnella luojiensis]TFE22765.1 mannitol-1-phosphate 5-dehydrogenase [Cohnella luojiensis]
MKAVHFGGGNIGRGFIGLLLSRSGYTVEFVDVDEQLVQLLNERGQYTVELANEAADTTIVRNIRAINGNDKELVAQAVAEADLVTTAVGVNVLKFIAPNIAEGIRRRLKSPTSPLHIIACENTIGGSTQLKGLVYEQLDLELREQADRRIAFPDAAVDRIVPIQQNEDRLKVVVEPFYEWVVDRSAMLEGFHEIEGIHYAKELQRYIERKLFTVNTGHCCAAYHGYLRGYQTIQEVMKDQAIVEEIRGALGETGAALIKQYDFDAADHETYIDKIIDRFRNPYLTDEVVRVGRSPIRKLSPNDRLVRPATMAHSFGIEVPYLTKAMAAALLFDYEEDPEATEIQRSLLEQGVSQSITRYTGLASEHPLHSQIITAYDSYKERK